MTRTRRFVSKIFPNRIRVTELILWLAGFILTFPILNASLGTSGTFWLYGEL